MSEKKQIQIFKEFHRLVPEILQRMNEDQELAFRAATNPLLAFREMGYFMTEEVEHEVEIFIRFTPKERKRLEDLEKQLLSHASKKIDFRKPEAIEAFITKDLKLKKISNLKALPSTDVIEIGRRTIEKKNLDWKDPLLELKKAHPAIPLLIEFRKILYSKPGFASKTYYDELKSGKRKLPISKIRITFPDGALIHEE